MSNFYIGDPHFFHHNIIRYDNRPFKNSEIMNNLLVTNWNNVVKPEDTVYILGDVSWSRDYQANKAILNMLNGHKILIKGNHDAAMRDVSCCFDRVVDYLEINDDGVKVVLFHYPILFWNNQFHDSVHLYAHVHNSHQWNIMESTMRDVRALQALPMRAYNVGCMMPWMNYTPQTLNDIISGYNTWAEDMNFDLRG